jgi:serine protease Do
MSATLITKSIRPMVAMLLTAGAVLMGAPAASADTPHPMAGLEKSIVFLVTKWSGFVQVPPDADTAGQGFWTAKLSYSVTCTGFYVSDTAHVVTAGHCVDPGEGRKVIIDGYLQDQNAKNLTDRAYSNWRVEGDMQGSPVDRGVLAIQPNGIDGATITSPTTVEVVDFKTPEAGDVALLHVPNVNKATPALIVAQNAPQVGDPVTSIGFPGDIQDITDQSQIARASFKSGTVSSQQVTPSGVVQIEVSTQLAPGMSGGPTVNKNDQVVGVNSRGLTTQAGFNFITNTPDLRSFLQSHNVALVNPPAPLGRSTAGGLTVVWYVVGGTVLVLVVAVGLLLVLRRRRGAQPATVGGAPVSSYPMPGPSPMQGPVTIDGHAPSLGGPSTATAEAAFPTAPQSSAATSGTTTEPAGGTLLSGASTHTGNFCPSCGAPHGHEDHFCPECGKPLT